MPQFKHGIVVAAHPLAARAGVEILKEGGNAIDAAAATALALGVVTPAFCGTGGGGFALIWLASEQKSIFLDYRERAPLQSTEDMFKLTSHGNVAGNRNSVGYKAIAVPGTVAGHSQLVEEFGNFTLRKVLQPAVRYARRGFRVSEGMADVWKLSVAKLRRSKGSRAVYLKNGRPYRRGNKIKPKDLAASLTAIAKHGPREFYEGNISNKILRNMAENDGLVSDKDLQGYKPTLREPLRGSYKGYEIISAPPPSSGGAIILQSLNALENYPLRDFGHDSGKSLHLIAEVLMRSYANVRPRICDPDFSQLPVNELISKDFARRITSSILPNAASDLVQPFDVRGAPTSSTSHLTVIDGQNNVVALTESIECYFGSGVVVPGTGILLNDTMHDFEPRPRQLNSVGPGRIPMSSMSPTIIMREGRPYLVAGSAGGTRIVSSTLQTIINVLEFGQSIHDAVASPRIHTQDNFVEMESRIPKSTIRELKEMGHHLKVRRPCEMYFGGVHAALIDGGFDGAADPRRDGVSSGY
jgi:gamma-glutamyltranspeptidase/glutathione hydrolase